MTKERDGWLSREMGSMNFLKFADNQKINAFIQFTRASYIGNSKIPSSS